MRTVLLGAALVTALSGLTLTDAARAAAGAPIVQPDQGRVGVVLSHDETAALADGPIPALVSSVVPLSRMGAGLHAGSQLERDTHGGVHASLRQLLLESVDHPDGHAIVFLDVPGSHGPRLLDVYQRWH
jgi:hypothetical protein